MTSICRATIALALLTACAPPFPAMPDAEAGYAVVDASYGKMWQGYPGSCVFEMAVGITDQPGSAGADHQGYTFGACSDSGIATKVDAVADAAEASGCTAFESEIADEFGGTTGDAYLFITGLPGNARTAICNIAKERGGDGGCL